MNKTIITFLCLLSLMPALAQDYRQTVRGKVQDKESGSPIEFAAIQLKNNNFQTSAISNEKGEFRFENVPVGRLVLRASCLGYRGIQLSNLELTTGKELIVTLEMSEEVVKLGEVSVKAYAGKEKTINHYAMVSGRTFSVEESHRYAGSDNDVSRMAMNFAGVSQLAETTNEIIIRGNSPVGVLFRLDGVDIPNPSHFGDGGTTGGPISMLNNNLLTNSDFLTGAFPAEYGNAISGVFDLRLRNGNNECHEFLVRTGLMGIETAAEGPLLRGKNASYLINYRYSTISLLRALGMQIMGTASTDYQDLTFKLNFPSTPVGTITLFGLGGNSKMKMFDSERDTTEEKQQMAYESDFEMDILYKNATGSLGLTHSYRLGSSAYTKLILSATSIRNFQKLDSLSVPERIPIPSYYSDFQRTKYTAKFYINKKISSRQNLRAGVSGAFYRFSLSDSLYSATQQSFRVLRNYSGNTTLTQAFIQYLYKFSNRLSIQMGINSLLQGSGKNFMAEPRVGIDWEMIPGHRLKFGYGLHSLTPPIEIQYQQVYHADGTMDTPNEDLGLIRSQHFVLGYDTHIIRSLRLKSEIYYQYISHVPVEIEPGSWSLLNRGAYSLVDVKSLKSTGKGYNYGLEITLEKFMDHGSYFLATLSLFDSKYKGSDDILRNTVFNRNFVFNLLGGKEFTLHRKKEHGRYIKKIVLDGKINWSGGQRYTPIDLESSEVAGSTILIDSAAFSNQLPDYFSLDMRLAYKWIGKNATQEIALDIRNLTNRENAFQVWYNTETGDINTKGSGLTPNLYYSIRF